MHFHPVVAEQPHDAVPARHLRVDVLDRHGVYVHALARNGKRQIPFAPQRGQRHAVVPCRAGDVPDRDVVTPDAQIDPVLVRYIVRRREADVRDLAVRGVVKRHPPVARIQNVQPAHAERVQVPEQNECVAPHRREPVPPGGPFRQAVRGAAVQRRAAAPLEDHVHGAGRSRLVPRARRREYVRVYAVRQTDRAAVYQNAAVRADDERPIDHVYALACRRVLRRDHHAPGAVQQRLQIFAVSHECLLAV